MRRRRLQGRSGCARQTAAGGAFNVTRELPSVAEALPRSGGGQHEESAARPVWPSSPAAAQGPSAEIGEAVVEQIVGRVLSRLAVGDQVTEVAGGWPAKKSERESRPQSGNWKVVIRCSVSLPENPLSGLERNG
jgi:hypothetical protein